MYVFFILVISWCSYTLNNLENTVGPTGNQIFQDFYLEVLPSFRNHHFKLCNVVILFSVSINLSHYDLPDLGYGLATIKVPFCGSGTMPM